MSLFLFRPGQNWTRPWGHFCHIMFHVDAPAQKLKLYLKVRYFIFSFCHCPSLPPTHFSASLSLSLYSFPFCCLLCGQWHIIYFCGHCATFGAPEVPKVIILKVFIYHTHRATHKHSQTPSHTDRKLGGVCLAGCLLKWAYT